MARGYSSEHLLALAAKAVIKDYYGRGPAYSYYDGCSTGGRQALIEAERYPADFNGILAGSPLIQFSALSGEEHSWVVLANRSADGHEILTSDKLPALHAAVMRACAAGGVIADPRSCDFNPASIQCPAGTDAVTCLTPAQVAAATRIYQGPSTPQGQLLFPGEPFGSELAWAGTFIEPASDTAWPLDTIDGQFADQGFRYQLLPQTLPASWKLTDWQFTRSDYQQLMTLSGLYDASDPDLSAFARDGGKLITWQPLADQDVPPTGTIDWYAHVVSAVGGYPTSQRFSRLYAIPGGYHCEGGGVPAVTGDLLTPLMNWVEHGQAPGQEAFPVTAPAAGQPATLTVAPMNPLAPTPGTARGLNDNYTRAINAYPTSHMWCSYDGMKSRCTTSRNVPAG